MAEDHGNDPLHGVTLEAMLKQLVEKYSWEGLAERIPVRCFSNEPSLKSSLTFLRRTPWARAKVEALFLGELRPRKAVRIPREKKGIEALFAEERAFAADVKSRGLEAWVERFPADGAMLSSRGAVEGPVAVRERMAPSFRAEGFSIEWSPDRGALSEDGSLGFTTGPSTVRRIVEGKPVEDVGRYLTVWRRRPDGRYEIIADCPIA